MVPELERCSPLNQNEPTNETVKVSGTKRSDPECLMNSPHQQTSIRNNGGYLVYVRRKPESEKHKNTMCKKSKDEPIKLCEHNEKNHQQSPLKDSTIHIPKNVHVHVHVHVHDPDTSSEGVSSAIPKRLNAKHWEERFFLLQNFLKVLDQSTQDDYRQMLRSLSSVDLSRLAFELERRTIQLSYEEAKEIQRAKVLDVQGKLESKT